MATKDSRTKAFATTAKPKKGGKKSPASQRRLRQQLVISIFAVIALILIVFATLIIGKIVSINKEKNSGTNPAPSENFTYVSMDSASVNVGNLLLINDGFKYTLPADLSDMINVYQYQKNAANNEYTKINETLTYTLTYDSICLNKITLDAFNKMILDYCNSPDFTSSNENFVSNLEIAWGGYSATTRHEYQQDVDNIGKDFYDHALGTTLTLKINDPSTPIKESILKSQFAWIYQNAHKYGFIIRYPDACASHTQVNKNVRVHLRYVGVEHATYIFNNQICLEEYLELIRTQHSYSNPLVVNSTDGKTYNVYYVEHSGNPTSVPVPQNSAYTISGDNMNGFIVSVEK